MTRKRASGAMTPLTPSRSWSVVERMERPEAGAEYRLVTRWRARSWSIWSVVVKLYIYIEIVTPVPYWSVMERLERTLLAAPSAPHPLQWATGVPSPCVYRG